MVQMDETVQTDSLLFILSYGTVYGDSVVGLL